jgi:transglutaminase-like putative cysteine protease
MKKVLKSTIDQLYVQVGPLVARLKAFDESQKQKDFLPAENSVVMRLIATLMAFLVITLACYYANVSLIQTVLYLILAVTGSYLAYLCRARRSTILTGVTVVGLIFVLGGLAQEFFFQLYVGKLNLLSAFIVAVAGLQALHMFDMRTRSDINTSAVVGLGCLASAGMIGQDIAFGIGVLIYVFLCSMLLYLQCVEYGAEGVVKASSSGELFSPNSPPPRKARGSAGSAVLMTSSLPVLALFIFFNIPRIESLLDRFITSTVSAYIPPVLTVASPISGAAGQGGGGSQSSSHRSVSGSFGAVAPKEVRGVRQVREGSNGKEVRFPVGFNRKGNSSENRSASSTAPSVQSKRTAKYSLADKATEEELTLNFAGKGAIAGENRLLFIIHSSREIFLRRLSFDTFDGRDWKVSSQHSEREFESKSPDIYTEIDYEALKQADFPNLMVTQEVEAVAELGHIVPAAWAPKMVAIPAEKVFVDESGTLRVKDEMPAGTKFRIVSKVPLYDLDVLRGESLNQESADKIRKSLQQYLQIPKNQGDQPALLAYGLTNRTGSWFVQAEKICDYLRNNFQYSLDVPPPAKSENLVNYFLFKEKRGDCSHFASAFVILCRSLGIPARCVGGFAPAVRNYLTGNYEVHASQAHAWAEIYVPKFGWVAFDPVPNGYLPGPRPDEGLIASMMRSDQVRSLYQSFDTFVREKGKESIGAAPNKMGSDDTADGTGSTPGSGKGAATGKGKSKNGAGAGSADQLRAAGAQNLGPGQAADSKNQPVGQPGLNLTIGGQAGRQSALNGSPLDLRFRELFHPPDLLWLFQNWTKVAAGFALLVLLGIVLYRLRKYLRGRPKKAVLDPSALKSSTLIYLRVIDDLSQVKFVRGLADTPREIVEKVRGLIDTNGNQDGLSELPSYLTAFMDKYVSNRFVEEETPEASAELEEMGNKIHVLLTPQAK